MDLAGFTADALSSHAAIVPRCFTLFTNFTKVTSAGEAEAVVKVADRSAGLASG